MNYKFAYHDRPCEPRNADESPEEWAAIAQWAEDNCNVLFNLLAEIAETGCAAGVCANSLDVCREMREKARLAVESYGKPADEEFKRTHQFPEYLKGG